MKRIIRMIPLVMCLTLLAEAVVGVFRFGWPDCASTAHALDGVWEYETDLGENGTVRLPWDLAVEAGTRQIMLTTMLPEWTQEGYALHFKTMEQTVEVMVGDERRYTYGGETDAADYVYRAATNINRIPLTVADSGKRLTIILRAPALFRIELGLLREVWIGTEADLVLSQFYAGTIIMLVSIFTILITLAALLMILTYKGASMRANLCILLLAVVTVIFYNTENSALWPIFQHAPSLSSLVDWFYYYLDALIPIAAWMTLYAGGWRFQRWQKAWALATGAAYILAAAVSLGGLCNFNITRPVFMASGAVLTLTLALSGKKIAGDGATGFFSTPVLILLLGYYLDYMKYILMLLPLTGRLKSFLQLKLPFQVCTGFALVIFTLLVLRETMGRLTSMETETRTQAAVAELQVQYAVQQYNSVCQRDLSLRQLRHDMQHHFRLAALLLQNGRNEEAGRYLAGLSETMGKLRPVSYCMDHVADITIGWYADQFSAAGVPFHVEVNIPTLPEKAHADVCCILSNALQNALEGSGFVETPDVTLFAAPKGGALLIKVENRCNRTLDDVKRFQTTKNGEGHGLGISSMQAAVKRHSGYSDFRVEEGVFRIDVVLNEIFDNYPE